MGYEFTIQQQQALQAGGTVLVSAAAGSGKTAVLVERVVRLITDLQHPVDADRLLVVTFTNAAAAEMRARIAARLKEELRRQPGSQHLKRQQYLLSRASICTIDSFCIGLLREYFYKLGLPPDFQIADGSRLASMEAAAMQQVLGPYFEQPDESFLRLCDLLGAQDAQQKISQAVSTLYEQARTLPFINRFFARCKALSTDVDTYLPVVSQALIQEVVYQRSRAREALTWIAGDAALEQGFAPAFSQMETALDTFKTLLERQDWDGAYTLAGAFAPLSARAPRKYPDTALIDRLKKRREEIRRFFERLPEQMIAPVPQLQDDLCSLREPVRLLLQLTQAYMQAVDQIKRRDNCMDFADAEHAVLQLLVQEQNGAVSPTPVAQELSRRYAQVLVDEYQDTNGLQNAIFQALSDGGRNLFMVGDVKQSIYRFRRADPGIFLHYRDSLPPYRPGLTASKVVMSGNFRSAPEICQFVNDTFRLLMHRETAEMDYLPEDELQPQAAFDSTVPLRIQMDLIDQGGRKSDFMAQEALHIANVIQTLCKQPAFIKDGDGLRTARYGDIAVLMRRGAHMAELKMVLQQAGIPVYSSAKEQFLQTRAVSVLLSLLRAVDNPMRDLPLLAVMMSELYAFTPDEIAALRLTDRTVPLYAAVAGRAQQDPKVSALFQDLGKYREWAASMPVSELIGRICDDSGYGHLARLTDDGQQAAEHMQQFIELARSFDPGGVQGLPRFLRYIRRVEESGETPFKVSAVSGGQDAVRLMTMHASKGLQFPVCILADLSAVRTDRDSRKNMLVSEQLGIGVKITDPARRIRYPSIAYRAIAVKNQQGELAEELRILYVAMTRAQDRLILIGSEPDATQAVERAKICAAAPPDVLHAGSYTQQLLLWAVRCSQPGFRLRVVPAAEIAPLSVSAQPTVPAADSALVRALCARLDYQYPYAAANEIARKQSASALTPDSYDGLYACTATPLFLQGQKLTAAQRGTAHHKFMQFADFAAAAADLQQEIVRLEQQGHLTGQEAKCLRPDLLRAFFESPLYKRMARSDTVLREQRFMVEMPARLLYPEYADLTEDQQVVVQGVADCVFVEDGGLVVVDYKTDRAAHIAQLEQKYRLQLQTYAYAFAQILQMPVKDIQLYAFYFKKAVSVEKL